MLFNRLNFNISINLIFILGTAALLTNIVIFMSTQRLLVNAEIAKGNQIISAIEDHINVFGKPASQSTIKNLSARIFHHSKASCILVLDSQFNEIYYGAKEKSSNNKLKNLTKISIKTEKHNIQFSGITWGVFWKQKKEIIISAPIYHYESIAGGASIILPLEDVYLNLRQTQSIILFYILINIIFLTLFGLYRFSKIFVKPLQSLLERAEKFKDDDELYFSSIQGSNEFNKLSRALNRMLYRISESKKELRETVSSLEKANITLKQAQHDIINAEKLASAGRLSAGIAHEIGNPIAIVMGYLDLLKRNDISEDEKKDFIARTGNEINRINKIIRQLLDLSRPSDGKRIKVSVHDIINDIISMLKCQPLMADINIKHSLKAEADTILADPSQLRQIFLNLMINASDAINSNKENIEGELLITTNMIPEKNFSSKPNIEIIFSDNGVGIPEDAVNNIFDPFYTTKDPGKGTGLGLSVCYMIIDSMGGNIKAVNNGNYTNILIHLPIYDSEKKYEC